MRIGRNDPCPCGSGKKHKKCCGGVSGDGTTRSEVSKDFELAKSTAYKGRIGRLREEFCKSYAVHRQNVFQDIEQALADMARREGKEISCRKGCSHCCAQYTEATVKEAEAIAYYLHENESIAAAFLGKYPNWRETIRLKGDIWKRLGQFWNQVQNTEKPEEKLALRGQHSELNDEYLRQRVSCPFLDDNGACFIYPVRPFTCVGYASISPADWCGISGTLVPRILRALPKKELFDCSFYYRDLPGPVMSFMPVMVYAILTQGILHVCAIPGFESVSEELARDSEFLAAAKETLGREGRSPARY